MRPFELEITGDELTELTTLKDLRHRQLAKEGYFDPPDKNVYKLGPTLRGLLKYYREGYHQNAKDMRDDKQIKLRREIELLEIKIEDEREKLIPIELVERVWQRVCIGMRQVILSAEMPTLAKEELARQLREVPIDEYLAEISESESEKGSATDKAPA